MPLFPSRSRMARAAVIVVAAAFALSGCASPATSTNSDKSPIVIFQTNSFSGQVSNKPQTKTGAEAAVREINASGGINGRSLKLISCDNTGDPNITNACVKSAKTSNAAAFVGSAIYFPATWKILDSEKIPYLLGTGLSPNEFTSPVSFPLSGQVGWYYGIAAYLKELGSKKPAMISCEIAACAYGVTLLDEARAKQGLGKVHSVIAPLSTTDYSSFAAAAMQGGTDAVVVSGSEVTAVSQAKALRQQGFTGKIISVSACISTGAVDNLAYAGDGLYVVGLLQSPTLKTAQISSFVADMNAVDKTAKKDELALGAWAGVKLFAEVAKGLPKVNAATVLAALNGAKVGAYDIGVTAPLPGSTSSPISALPRLKFSPTVTYNQVTGGTIIQSKPGFLNPFIASK